jgi:hypothetical protein
MRNSKTQENRILELLRERGQLGAYIYEFMTPNPNGLGIAQYGARIYSLRRKGFNIINKQPGHFVLEEQEPVQLSF